MWFKSAIILPLRKMQENIFFFWVNCEWGYTYIYIFIPKLLHEWWVGLWMFWLPQKEKNKQTLEVFHFRCCTPTDVLLVFHTAAFCNEVSPFPWEISHTQDKETWFKFFEVIIQGGKESRWSRFLWNRMQESVQLTACRMFLVPYFKPLKRNFAADVSEGEAHRAA